jgi:hypothetical protein
MKIKHVHTVMVPQEDGSQVETRVEIEIPQFESQGAEELFENHRSEVYHAIVTGITRMMNMKTDTIACFSIGDLVFELGKETSEDNLKRCIQYYQELEDYETCAFIVQNLLPYINS